MADVGEPIYFPPVTASLEGGLLRVGGQLTPDWLLAAYERGIFPWPVIEDEWEVLAWFSPDPRAVIELDGLHVSRRLARRIRSGQFQVTLNRDFAGVISGCMAPRRDDSGTWITPEIRSAYQRLHELGYAHSVEVWSETKLVGGLYGVALGGMFAGESMFHRERDASKVALFGLQSHLRQRGFTLFDIQQQTNHSKSMGAVEISRAEFLLRLHSALTLPVTFGECSDDDILLCT